MQKITPHLWFDTQAKEATALYVSLFADSRVKSVTVIPNTPSGDTHMVEFTLAGKDFLAMSAGPYFKFNPAISLFVTFDTEQDIEKAWDTLVEGGTVLMEYKDYPWAHKYGWLQDKYGLSWQLSWSEHHQLQQRITPLLMFTKDKAGKAKEAIEYYTSIFPDSKTDMLVPYEKGDGDTEGQEKRWLKHARFALAGTNFMAMDSSGPHEFTFNEAISFVVNCDTQEEIDMYWDKLSAVPQSEQCGWCKDKYGVSWQIVPSSLATMMHSGDKEKTARVTQAFLKMKKFDIATLERAYKGE